MILEELSDMSTAGPLSVSGRGVTVSKSALPGDFYNEITNAKHHVYTPQ